MKLLATFTPLQHHSDGQAPTRPSPLGTTYADLLLLRCHASPSTRHMLKVLHLLFDYMPMHVCDPCCMTIG